MGLKYAAALRLLTTVSTVKAEYEAAFLAELVARMLAGETEGEIAIDIYAILQRAHYEWIEDDQCWRCWSSKE